MPFGFIYVKDIKAAPIIYKNIKKSKTKIAYNVKKKTTAKGAMIDKMNLFFTVISKIQNENTSEDNNNIFKIKYLEGKNNPTYIDLTTNNIINNKNIFGASLLMALFLNINDFTKFITKIPFQIKKLSNRTDVALVCYHIIAYQ